MTDYSAYHWAKKAEEWAQQAAGVTSVNGKTGTVTLDASDVGAQETLVSGTNIKTINNSTILGSGNLDIDGLPSQTGNAGKFLTTDGTDAGWGVPKTHNLFDFIWRDAELNDMAWLRADTFSWQDGTVYTEAYNHLDADLESSKKTFYGWISGNPLDLSNYYTLSASPSVGDAIYSVENNTSADVLTKVASISGTTLVGENGVSYFSNSPETRQLYELSKDTIGAFDVYYYLASDGHKIVAALNEEDVADVYDEFGVAWYYILDTANQKFKLPRTKYGFVGLRDAVGKYVPETLPTPPNHTHTVGDIPKGQNNGGKDVFAGGNDDTTWKTVTSSVPSWSASNVYQDNAPVQQRATQMYLYFYVGNFSQSATEQTAGLNSSLFNGKADIDMSNVPSNIGSTAKSYFAGLGMPSDTYKDLTLLASGQSYTAPADGYVQIKKVGGVANAYIEITQGSIDIQLRGLGVNDDIVGFLPISKGSFSVTYNATGTTKAFKFIYAKGNESEAS